MELLTSAATKSYKPNAINSVTTESRQRPRQRAGRRGRGHWQDEHTGGTLYSLPGSLSSGIDRRNPDGDFHGGSSRRNASASEEHTSELQSHSFISYAVF